VPKTFDPKRCAKIVAWPSVQCSRDAKYPCEGKPYGYCKQHHPDTVQAKAEAQRVAFNARDDARQRRHAAENRRRDVVEAAKRWHATATVLHGTTFHDRTAAAKLYEAVEALIAAERAVVAAQ
jgi:hypothetical protein